MNCNISSSLELKLGSFLQSSTNVSNLDIYNFFLSEWHKKENMQTINRRHCSNMSIMHGLNQLFNRLERLLHKTLYTEFLDRIVECLVNIFNVHEIVTKTNVLLYNMSYKKMELARLTKTYGQFLIPLANSLELPIKHLVSAIIFHCREQEEYLLAKCGTDDELLLVRYLGTLVNICNDITIHIYKKPAIDEYNNYQFL